MEWLEHILEVCGFVGRDGRSCFIQGQGLSSTGVKRDLKDEEEVSRQRWGGL